MSEKKNDTKKIWRYAIILFIGILAVLLLTAYSQIKLTRNVDDYRQQLQKEIKEKGDFQINLNSSIETNKQLKDELEKVKKDLDGEKKKNSESVASNTQIQSTYKSATSSYEALLLAEAEYNQGNIIESSLILKKQCQTAFLGDEAMKRYNDLYAKAVVRAAKQLYNNGVNEYRKKDYTDAIMDLQQSLFLVDNQYFSDGCYFYIAYSQYKLNKKNDANKTLDTLIKKYPDSDYIQDAYELIEIMN